MQRIHVIGLIVLLLSLPIPAWPSPPPRRRRQASRTAVTSPGWSTSAAARSIWSATATGSPTVILVAGYRASGRYWSDDLLHPDAPRTDGPARGGRDHPRLHLRPPGDLCASIGDDDFLSRSDPIAQPRTAPEVVAELHALLQAAEVPGPYVLAGHSLGGFFARLYAGHLPRRGRRPRPRRRLLRAAGERDAARAWQALVRLNQELGADTVVPIPGYGDVETIGFGADNAVMREAVAASPLPPMPLAVLAHGKPFALPAETHRGSPPRSWKRSCRRRTRSRPPSSRTRASPWPPRAATTSTRINRSW